MSSIYRNRLTITEFIPHAHPQREVKIECGKNVKRKFTTELTSEYYPTKILIKFTQAWMGENVYFHARWHVYGKI